MLPKYPIYIPSKGRWEVRQTSEALESMGIPYRIVVEPQEYDDYAKRIGPLGKVCKLPFSNLGQGSIPARNWIFDHSLAAGHGRHWQIDDNITGFYRLNRNLKVPVGDGSIFRASEDFVDRYTNVGQSGFHYFMFAARKAKVPPYTSNTRVYSCTLNNNAIPHRYRGRYNEDTDLSLRVLKDGWCTILFLAFLAMKSTTMTMAGGNTDELYRQDEDFDGRLEMARHLQRQHPDVTKIVRKWGRWQHQVDYRPFKNNKLILRKGVEIPKGVNNYGMKLVKVRESDGVEFPKEICGA